MRAFGLATIIAITSIASCGQAFAQHTDHHRKPAHHDRERCHTERHKVKVHGKWIMRTVEVCKRS